MVFVCIFIDFEGKKAIALTNRDSYFSNKNKTKIYFSQA
jgi:hypothetical protein